MHFNSKQWKLYRFVTAKQKEALKEPLVQSRNQDTNFIHRHPPELSFLLIVTKDSVEDIKRG